MVHWWIHHTYHRRHLAPDVYSSLESLAILQSTAAFIRVPKLHALPHAYTLLTNLALQPSWMSPAQQIHFNELYTCIPNCFPSPTSHISSHVYFFPWNSIWCVIDRSQSRNSCQEIVVAQVATSLQVQQNKRLICLRIYEVWLDKFMFVN